MGQRQARIKQVFEALDLDKSGSIEKWELIFWIKNEPYFSTGSGLGDACAQANDLMRKIDKNGDSHIQIKELEKYFEGWSDEELEKATTNLVKRGRSQLTEQKLGEIKKEISSTPSKNEVLIKMFYRLDLDKSGTVSLTEIMEWVSKEDAFKEKDSKEKALELLTKMDKDGDRRVTYTEFCDFFKDWKLPDILTIAHNLLSSPPKTKGKAVVVRVIFPGDSGGFLTTKCTEGTTVRHLKEAVLDKITKRRILAKNKSHTVEISVDDFSIALDPSASSLDDKASVITLLRDSKQPQPWRLFLTAISEGAEEFVLGIGKPKSDRWVLKETDDIEKHYELGDQLGTPGQFGFALLATHLKTKTKAAVKVISKTSFRTTAERKVHFEQLRREIEVMKQMDHPNIIKFYEVFENVSRLHIVMELCEGGELFDRIKAKERYNEKDASVVLRQLMEAVQFMHKKKIAHCDLKPDNFLFLSKKEDSPLKIIDFGMSKFVERRKYFSTLCGTSYYIAPEVIDGHYTEPCDIWSLGVVMFIMLYGYPPFYANPAKYGTNTNRKIFQLIKKGFNPVTQEGYGPWFNSNIPISDSAKSLISKLLTSDMAKRITASEALEHPWLKGETASTTPLVMDVLRNLKEFTGACKFKQAVLSIMVDVMDDDELDRLKKAFTLMDVDGDGNVTVAELRKVLNSASATDSSSTSTASSSTVEPAFKRATTLELNDLLSRADLDGNGSLSYEELLMTSIQRKIINKEERLWQAFCRIDLDGNGVISREELEGCLGTENKELAEDILKRVDVDGDGLVDYEEFLAMWQNERAAAALSPFATGAHTTFDEKDLKTPKKGVEKKGTGEPPGKEKEKEKEKEGVKAEPEKEKEGVKAEPEKEKEGVKVEPEK